MTGGPEGVPVYHNADYESNIQPFGHPESPDRVAAIMILLRKCGLGIDLRLPSPANESDILLAHTKEHLALVRDLGVGYMDPDTFHDGNTYRYAMNAAGGTCMAARDCVVEKRPIFSLARPPGHHAGADYNMGFCYFNNVAIAARKLMKEREDVRKVAIIDIDAHHGNGTNDIFYSDPNVLYISTHQWGIFPGTGHYKDVGKGEGEGKTINLPLRGGTGDPTFREIADTVILPATKEFAPDAILISLGGDSHQMDPLTGLSLSTPGYLSLLRSFLDIAHDVCSDRICFELEGGYHPQALAETVVGCMNMCSPQPVDLKIRYSETREVTSDSVRIRELTDHLSSYWKI
jgi:acetoin utilization deacetylase AcuC-like enzyme